MNQATSAWGIVPLAVEISPTRRASQVSWLGRKDRHAVPDKSRHRLGNLVLLPPKLNSAVQDKPAKGKAAHYRKTGLLIAGEVADVIDPPGWNSRSIKERGERLLE